MSPLCVQRLATTYHDRDRIMVFNMDHYIAFIKQSTHDELRGLYHFGSYERSNEGLLVAANRLWPLNSKLKHFLYYRNNNKNIKKLFEYSRPVPTFLVGGKKIALVLSQQLVIMNVFTLSRIFEVSETLKYWNDNKMVYYDKKGKFMMYILTKQEDKNYSLSLTEVNCR